MMTRRSLALRRSVVLAAGFLALFLCWRMAQPFDETPRYVAVVRRGMPVFARSADGAVLHRLDANNGWATVAAAESASDGSLRAFPVDVSPPVVEHLARIVPATCNVSAVLDARLALRCPGPPRMADGQLVYHAFWGTAARARAPVDESRDVQTRLSSCPALEHRERYRFTDVRDWRDHSQYSQALAVSGYFRGTPRERGGFFVEAGANDGVRHSNTAFFEFRWGWEGLLVEPDPQLHRLAAQRRGVFTMRGCLSAQRHTAAFDAGDGAGLGSVRNGGALAVPCYRLTDVLLAAGRTHVDFLSLDVEGHELDVLRGLDTAVITVDVVVVEYMAPQGWADPRNKDNLRSLRMYLEPRGFLLVALLPTGCTWQRDCIDALFVRNHSGLSTARHPSMPHDEVLEHL